MTLRKMILIAFALLAVSCGEDKDVEQYQREKLAEEMVKFQKVAGDYGGQIYSNKTDKPMGSLRVTLIATTKQGQQGGAQAPSLNGTILFLGKDQGTINFQDAHYDEETGSLVASFAVPMSGQNVLVNFTAGIRDGKLDGKLEAGGYVENAVRLSAAKNVPAPASMNSPELLKTLRFKARQLFHGDPVYMTVDRQTQKIEQRLVNLLMPIQTVSVTLDFTEGNTIVFPEAQVDQRSDLLEGRVVMPHVPEGGYTLRCAGFSTVPMTCNFSGDTHGQFGRFDFDPHGGNQ